MQALSLGEYDGYARTLLDLAAPMRWLLGRVRGDWRPYAERLLLATTGKVDERRLRGTQAGDTRRPSPVRKPPA
jgi:hypothetical protein